VDNTGQGSGSADLLGTRARHDEGTFLGLCVSVPMTAMKVDDCAAWVRKIRSHFESVTVAPAPIGTRADNHGKTPTTVRL
jgi:hypothetical protein